MTTISYAQNYEDVMLARALADIDNGFYVDVGAQHPINGSVTKAFSVKGWRGINIDPVERWHRLVCEDRPNDINLCVPIAEKPGFVELYDVEDTGLSTLRDDYAAEHANAGWNVVARRLKAHSLNSVFRAHVRGEVHFLKVDVEGAEESVLRSLDFTRFRPWIVLVEATKPNSPEPAFEDWEPLLLGACYNFVYDDGLNRFYLAHEHAARAVHFKVPPNFFDHFLPYSEWWAREQMDRLGREVESERARPARDDSALIAAQAALAKTLQEEQVASFEAILARREMVLDATLARHEALLGGAFAEGLASVVAHFEAKNRYDADAVRVVDQRLEQIQLEQVALASRITRMHVETVDVGALEDRLRHMEIRLEFADNVQRAFTASAERERLAEASYQSVVNSRSWRLTAGLRAAHGTVHRTLQRLAVMRPSRAEVRGRMKRVVERAIAHPLLRRGGALALRLAPGLKQRLVRMVVDQPAPAGAAVPPEQPNHELRLSRRAGDIRAMMSDASGGA